MSDDFYVDDDPPEEVAEMWARFQRGEFDGFTHGPFARITHGPNTTTYWCNPIFFDFADDTQETE